MRRQTKFWLPALPTQLGSFATDHSGSSKTVAEYARSWKGVSKLIWCTLDFIE